MTVAVLLGLLSAVTYGASDFLAGLSSRRLHYARVGLVTQGSATVAVFAGLPFAGGHLTGQALVWGAVAGLGSGTGSVALYRGLGRGRMSVVGPVSGAGSAAIPVVAGLLLGERPSPVALGGVALAVPAVWLVSSSGGLRTGGLVEGAVDGMLAGVGFGVMFLALSRAGQDTGLWPTAAAQLVAFGAIGVFVLAGVRGGAPRVAGAGPAWLGAAAAGVLGAAATVSYLISTRYGLLVVVAVLAALYPGATVLLARFVLHERAGRLQLAGLALAAVAVVAITAG